MGAAAFVAGVVPQLEEILDVVVPGFQVGAAGAAAFAALVDGDELVVVQLEEGDDALAFAIGALDVAAGAADGRPRSAESAGPLGEEGVFGDAAEHDGLDGVIHLVEVAGRELAVEGAGVEERGCARAEAAALCRDCRGEIPIPRDPSPLGGRGPWRRASRRTAGSRYGGSVAGLVDDEVAVVQRLDAEVVEVEIGGRVEGVGELVEIILKELGAEALDGDAVAQVGFKGLPVRFSETFDAVAQDAPVEDFLVDVGEENASGELGEVRVLFDERLGVEDDGAAQAFLADFSADGAAKLALDASSSKHRSSPMVAN